MAGRDIIKKLKKINETEYNFTEDQTNIFNLLMEGYSAKNMVEILGKSMNSVQKNIRIVKKITGLERGDICYIQHRRKAQNNHLEKKEQEAKRMIGEFIAPRYLGFQDTKTFPKYMYIRISQLRRQYSYRAIYETILRNKNKLDYAFENKEFKNIEHKLNYIMVVIRNNIEEVQKEIEEKEKLTISKEKELLETRILESINEIKRAGATKKKDFSDFLDKL